MSSDRLASPILVNKVEQGSAKARRQRGRTLLAADEAAALALLSDSRPGFRSSSRGVRNWVVKRNPAEAEEFVIRGYARPGAHAGSAGRGRREPRGAQRRLAADSRRRTRLPRCGREATAAGQSGPEAWRPRCGLKLWIEKERLSPTLVERANHRGYWVTRWRIGAASQDTLRSPSVITCGRRIKGDRQSMG